MISQESMAETKLSYTGCFGQPTDGPLVKARGSIYRRDIRVLHEWLTDNVHCKAALAILDIICRVFDPSRSVRATKGHQGRPVSHLDARC